MTNEELEHVIERIEHLEKIFDEVQTAFKNDPKFFENKKSRLFQIKNKRLYVPIYFIQF